MTQTTWGAVDNVTVTAAGSAFESSAFTLFNGSNFNLGGYEVTVRIGSGNYFRVKGGMTNGTLNVVSGGWIVPFGSFSAPTVSLVNNAAINVGAATTVRDYTSNYGGKNYNLDSAALNVLGTFTPKTDYFYGCTLQHGSTLDLSTRTGVWNTQASFTGSGQATGKRVVDFADGATITVDLGDRTVRSRDKIISWTDATKQPASVRFRPMPDSSYSFVAKEDGLYVSEGLIILFR